MANKIHFDASGAPEQPTLVLTRPSGERIGLIVTNGDEKNETNLNDVSELSFSVSKYLNGELNPVWDELTDFKIVWDKTQNKLYRAEVSVTDDEEQTKDVSCKDLGHVELGNRLLHGIEINTEDDIARKDYKEPTVLFNEKNKKASLLHRILSDKAPDYTIGHVDSTIASIQRTFSFDNTSIGDALNTIADEEEILFTYNCSIDDDGNMKKVINAYDLCRKCKDCGHRWSTQQDSCPKCGSKNYIDGYGEDTAIFVSSDGIGDNLKSSVNVDSVKNCFKLEAGDDLMTATVRNFNANGSDYIWYFSDDMKKDMPDEIVKKLDDYTKQSQYYQNEYPLTLSKTNIDKYNAFADKYVKHNKELERIETPVVGYSSLMTSYYKTIDMLLYIKSGMMPVITMSGTSAADEAKKLTSSALSPVSVANIASASKATVDSAVKALVKTVVDSRYQVEIKDSSYSNKQWTGKFYIEAWSDENDKATSQAVTLAVNGDLESYLKQQIDRVLKDADDKVDYSIKGIFKLSESNFKTELTKYGLNQLDMFNRACQACLDMLIAQGIPSGTTTLEQTIYNDLYTPYYNKKGLIEAEMTVRQGDLDAVQALQDELSSIRSDIQSKLDFKTFIGEANWIKLFPYIAEDKYQNDNFISDGLTNTELFNNAKQFWDIASAEIFKSAERQYNISGNIYDIFTIEEVKQLADHFDVGNWIRVQVDNTVYKLRLISYSIDYSNLEKIDVDFSTVTKTANGISDIKSILDQASSMATSYSSTKRQADKGAASKKEIDNIFAAGLDATNANIIQSADHQYQKWGEEGLLLGRLDDDGNLEPEQMKATASTIAITDDKWKTLKTAIGKFYYVDPETNELTSAYGINADVVIGNLILGKKLGIYNGDKSLRFDEDGLTIDTSKGAAFTITDGKTKQFSVDSDGNVVLDNGAIIKWGNINLTDLILNPSNVQVTNPDGTKQDIASYVSTKYAAIENLTAGQIDAVKGEFEELIAGYVKAEQADIKYANIDFANIGVAAVKKLFADSGIIKDIVVKDQHITGELVGVTIKGDLIEGNTIVADKLVVKGNDGLFYKLNTDGVSVTKEQTSYNSLNGSVITAKSITADRVSVSDLVAFGATIGGFHLTDTSIYSGAKENVYNTTDGIYMDRDGQFAIGDSEQYIRFYKDENGKRQFKMLLLPDSVKIDTNRTLKQALDKTVASIRREWYESTSQTYLTGGSWGTTIPTWKQGKYIWSRDIKVYTDGTESDPENIVCISGSKGDKGEQGDRGPQGAQGPKGDKGDKGADFDPNKLKIGGRNLCRHTSLTPVSVTTPTTASATLGAGFNLPGKNSGCIIPYGVWWTASVEILLPITAEIVVDVNNFPVGGDAWSGSDNDKTDVRGGNHWTIEANVWTKIQWTCLNQHPSNTKKLSLSDESLVGLKPQSKDITWQYRGLKVELGTIATDWTPAPEDLDEAIATAKAAGDNAKKSADAKSLTYYQGSAPSNTGRPAGDTWFDSSNNNRVNRWDGSKWVALQLGQNAIADLAITNAKIADATIQSAKIASIDAAKITTGTLSADRIGAKTITVGKLADSLSSDISTAKTNASSAVSTANTANSTANTAKSTADSAKSTANTASTNATNAVNTANAANNTVNGWKYTNTTQIDGGKIYTGTITADKLNANSIVVGGKNLLKGSSLRYTAFPQNRNFESQQVDNVTFQQLTTDGWHYKTASNNTGVNSSMGIKFKIADLGLKIGDTISISVDLKGTFGSTNNGLCVMHATNESTNFWDATSASNCHPASYSTWTRIRRTYTIPSNFAHEYLYIFFGGGTDTRDADVYARYVMIEKGSLPSDWSPSPEDWATDATCTEINGSYIKTGSLSASKITTGTMSADRINGGKIKGQTIEGGTISGTTITGGSLTSSKTVTVGTGKEKRTMQISDDMIYLKRDLFDSSDEIINEYDVGTIAYEQRMANKFYSINEDSMYVTGYQGLALSSLNGNTVLGASDKVRIKGINGVSVESASSFSDRITANNGINVHTEGIELYHPSTPYIDFHYANSTADYTGRLACDESGLYSHSTIRNLSDKRAKSQIKSLDKETAIEIIDKLVPKEYHYRKHVDTEVPYYGFIAQEVEATLDEVGIEGKKPIVNGGEDRLASIDYSQITPLLVSYVQALKKEIHMLRGENVELRKETETVKGEMKRVTVENEKLSSSLTALGNDVAELKQLLLGSVKKEDEVKYVDNCALPVGSLNITTDAIPTANVSDAETGTTTDTQTEAENS